MTELPKVHRTEAEEMLGNEAKAPVISETDNGSYLEIPTVHKEPETIAVRGGIHERIQAEIQHEDKEVAGNGRRVVRQSAGGNEVLDLMMETEDGGMITVAATKRKRD